MCWSAEVSFATFASAVLCGAAGIASGVRVTGFYWSFVGIQLFEGLMWLDQGCGPLNAAATLAAAAALAVQPLFSLLAFSSAAGSPAPPLLAGAYGAGAAFFLWLFWDAASRSGAGPCSRPPGDGSSRHLAWPFLAGAGAAGKALHLAWLASFLYPMAAYFDGAPWSYAGAALNLGALAPSVYHGWRNGTWGTNWCYYANLAGAGVLAQSVLRTAQHA
jgi:hypothetical protein